MGLAQVRALREEAVERRLEDAAHGRHRGEVRAAGRGVRVGSSRPRARSLERIDKRVHLKYEGTDTSLAVPLGAPEAMRAEFERLYRSRFSFLMPDRALIVEAVSVEAVGKADAPGDSRCRAQAGNAARGEPPSHASRCAAAASAHDTPVFIREQLAPRRRASRARRSSRRRTPPPSSSPSWEARVTDAGPPGARARRAAQGRATRSAPPPTR